MAANNSTIDGMGFEEVNQSSFTEMISGNNLYGNNLWISDMAEINQVSGLTGSFGWVYVTNDIDAQEGNFDQVQVDNGPIHSTSIQNATELFGYKVKAGSVLTGDDGVGIIAFVDAGSFSTVNYFMTLSPQNWTLPAASNEAGSSANFVVSGTRRASGCTVIGPSGTVADWIAVGL